MITEKELKKLREIIEHQNNSDAAQIGCSCCASCVHYTFRVKKNNRRVDILHYCAFSGRPATPLDVCDKYENRNFSGTIYNENRKEFLQRYISPLEYIGLVSRVLPSLNPFEIVFYAEHKIYGKEVKVQIDTSHYETHTVSFFMDDPNPLRRGDQIFIISEMPSNNKCGEGYSKLLSDCIMNALAEFKDFCDKEV